MKEIESEITLAAEPERVWQVLFDFESYPEWNPFITRMQAVLGEGEPFKAMSRLPAGIKLGFVGTIEKVAPYEVVAWVGRPSMMPSAAMKVRHTFTIAPVDGGTRLHQHEAATGFMIPLSGWILGQAQKGQVELNDALAERLSS